MRTIIFEETFHAMCRTRTSFIRVSDEGVDVAFGGSTLSVDVEEHFGQVHEKDVLIDEVCFTPFAEPHRSDPPGNHRRRTAPRISPQSGSSAGSSRIPRAALNWWSTSGTLSARRRGPFLDTPQPKF